MIHLYLKRQSNIIDNDSNLEKNREKLCRLLETARSQNSGNTVVKKLKGSASRKIRSTVSQSFTKHTRRVPGLNAKSEKIPVDHWPS